jgi:hypothetical protein
MVFAVHGDCHGKVRTQPAGTPARRQRRGDAQEEAEEEGAYLLRQTGMNNDSSLPPTDNVSSRRSATIRSAPAH